MLAAARVRREEPCPTESDLVSTVAAGEDTGTWLEEYKGPRLEPCRLAKERICARLISSKKKKKKKPEVYHFIMNWVRHA